MNAEAGRPPRKGKEGEIREDKHKVRINKAKKVNLSVIKAYLEGKMDFDTSILEAISQLILLRSVISG